MKTGESGHAHIQLLNRHPRVAIRVNVGNATGGNRASTYLRHASQRIRLRQYPVSNPVELFRKRKIIHLQHSPVFSPRCCSRSATA